MQIKQNNDMGKNFNLTKQQTMFVAGKEVLDRLDRIEETRLLTAVEESQRNETKTILLQEVMRFATVRAKNRMCNQKNNSDDLKEVKQKMACEFFKGLKRYDPTKETPSAYFTRYFDEVIFKKGDSYYANKTK